MGIRNVLSLLSINESRISIVVLTFLATVGVACYQCISIGDIGDNLLTLLSYQIFAIAGINVADKFQITKKGDEYDG